MKSQVRSRHPSHNILRNKIDLPFRSIIRLGSTHEIVDGKKRVELNSVEAIRNSSSKLRMKNKFRDNNIKTADWTTNVNDVVEITEGWEYAIVAKHHFGSKGTGNYLLKSQEDFNNWKEGKNLNNYLFERFYNYGHEFRLHVSRNGCFYTCRKALKADVPENHKWHFHDETCVWYLDNNDKFFKPNSWEDIVKECEKALEALGGDILAFDVKVQSPVDKKGKKREYQDFIILESNSAASLGDITAIKYLEEIPKVLKQKYNELQY